MQMRLTKLGLATVVSAAVASGSALAGPALDDDTSSPTTGSSVDPELLPAAETPVEYGVGVRLRSVRAPKGLLQIFVDSAPGSISNYGVGVDLVRRRGNLELQLGFEFEHIQPAQGVWIQRSTNVANGDEADYILGPDSNNGKSLGWFTIEFTFLNHTPLSKHIALRYGAGAGLGIVTGELGRYDIICGAGATNASPEPGCVPPRFSGTGQYSSGQEQIVPYDLPPVFPVVNAILGLQVKPTPKMTINVEGGIRTFPFFGISGGYFF